MKNYSKYWYFVIIIFIISQSKLIAIDFEEDIIYGASFEYNYEHHNINTKSLSEINYLKSGEFVGEGDNFRYFIDLAYAIADGNKLMLSLGYSNRSIINNFYEKELINLDSTAIIGTLNNELNFKSESFVIKFSYLYEFPSSVGLGTSLYYNINLDNTFAYKQKIESPRDRGYFVETGTRIRNEQNGKLDNFSNSNLSANIFIYKEFPLEINYKIVAIPKLGIERSIFYVDKSSEWSYYSYYFSIAILFN